MDDYYVLKKQIDGLKQDRTERVAMIENAQSETNGAISMMNNRNGDQVRITASKLHKLTEQFQVSARL